MNKILKQKTGIALLTVLLTFLSLFILLSAIVYMSIQNTDNTKLTNNYSKAYYIAESSLNKRLAEVNSVFITLANSNPNPADLYTLLENQISLLPSEITFDQTEDTDSALLSFIASDWTEDYPDYMFYKIEVT